MVLVIVTVKRTFYYHGKMVSLLAMVTWTYRLSWPKEPIVCHGKKDISHVMAKSTFPILCQGKTNYSIP